MIFSLSEKQILAIPFDDVFQNVLFPDNTLLHLEFKKDHDLFKKTFFSTISNGGESGASGGENYRQLAYLSTLFQDSTILHIGGSLLSTLALTFEKKNNIWWMDFQQKYSISQIQDFFQNIKVEYTHENIFENEIQEQYKERILKTSLIFFDVHPHIGTIEYVFYEFLKNIEYPGFIVFNEIWAHKEMRNEFWYKIPPENKYDITKIGGNEKGTGIVSFNTDISFPKNVNDNWTLVTSYFNLTKCPDASNEIKNRNYYYYLSHASSTMALPYNLVVYCDKESFEEIEKLRPAFLKHKTQYYFREFDNFQFCHEGVVLKETFADYRKKIIENRETHPYHFDPRNTASYYLFCLSRYLIIKEIIETNPFQSTHFAWINICIERMGYKNLVHLDEALAVKRNKFSTCYIDYQPKELVQNTNEYFKWGRCSMCSGFFTGNDVHMYTFCDLLEKKFLFYLNQGRGHSDETLFSPIYFDRPDIFEHYYGDYTEMITNYKYVHERATEPIHNFIKNSFENENYEKCFEACNFVFKSYCLKKCKIPKNYVEMLYFYYMNCKKNLNIF